MDVKEGLIVAILVTVAGIIVAVELYDKACPNGARLEDRRLCECAILVETIVLVVLLAIW